MTTTQAFDSNITALGVSSVFEKHLQNSSAKLTLMIEHYCQCIDRKNDEGVNLIRTSAYVIETGERLILDEPNSTLVEGGKVIIFNNGNVDKPYDSAKFINQLKQAITKEVTIVEVHNTSEKTPYIDGVQVRAVLYHLNPSMIKLAVPYFGGTEAWSSYIHNRARSMLDHGNVVCFIKDDNSIVGSAVISVGPEISKSWELGTN